MCDIWKNNQHSNQLVEEDLGPLLRAFRKFGTTQVVMSGGEALLNPKFFYFCQLLKHENISITLLSTGLLLKKYATQIVEHVQEVIVSLDGDEDTHNSIRNIPGAYSRMQEGIAAIRELDPYYRITARSVIHRLNYKQWPSIIDAGRWLGLDQISFLPADVSSQAFNREVPWNQERQDELVLRENELQELQCIIEGIIDIYRMDFTNHFIAESPAKLRMIYNYYAAYYQLAVYPVKKCNAPWVSAVIEADGSVLPCFFHSRIGNIRETPLETIMNSREAISFRKSLDMSTNSTCRKCVCSVYLSPLTRFSR
jgi:MoaA/NifB/PqqE/SkfB family radical SAM enzyme